MNSVGEDALTSDPQDYDEQELARMLMRRLIAERNLRTSGISHLLGQETHTVRRMLNGQRAISLVEVVLIARLGGYSLDEVFLQSKRPSTAMRQSSSEESLSKVFGAIADLLSGTTAVQPPPAQAAPFIPRTTKKAASTDAGSAVPGKRGRGRPRKNQVGPDGLPGPQW
jgi:plasmid maintenance system antidote protein VapI